MRNSTEVSKIITFLFSSMSSFTCLAASAVSSESRWSCCLSNFPFIVSTVSICVNLSICVCMYVCMYIYIYTCIYIYIYMKSFQTVQSLRQGASTDLGRSRSETSWRSKSRAWKQPLGEADRYRQVISTISGSVKNRGARKSMALSLNRESIFLNQQPFSALLTKQSIWQQLLDDADQPKGQCPTNVSYARFAVQSLLCKPMKGLQMPYQTFVMFRSHKSISSNCSNG